jgi:hypothetical protein
MQTTKLVVVVDEIVELSSVDDVHENIRRTSRIIKCKVASMDFWDLYIWIRARRANKLHGGYLRQLCQHIKVLNIMHRHASGDLGVIGKDQFVDGIAAALSEKLDGFAGRFREVFRGTIDETGEVDPRGFGKCGICSSRSLDMACYCDAPMSIVIVVSEVEILCAWSPYLVATSG